MRTIIPTAFGAVALAAALPASAQSLAQRVAQAPPDATVVFEYAAKPGVCGDGDSIMLVEHGTIIMRDGRETLLSTGGSRTRSGDCFLGPVRIEMRGGTAPAELRARVGATGTPRNAENLGTVAPAEASAFLIEAARRTRSGKVGETAVFAATLAEGVDPWRDLLALARDGGATPKTRNSAVFWVGQAVSDRATAGLAELVGDDDADLEARETAVFALSQRRDAEAVPALLEVAQASPHAKLRRSAIFWLGQSKDPRALAWFEEVLLGESRRQP